jgi:threonylcarbamoyladenosine tRNA methylthiotransferase CDKAL1
VGMTNPPYILEHLEEMAKILVHPRVYAFLHVPVQAASDKVLQDMRREYTLKDFKRVVDTLRDKVCILMIIFCIFKPVRNISFLGKLIFD